MSNHSEYTEVTWRIEFAHGCREYSDQLARLLGNAVRQLSFEYDDDAELGKEVVKAVNAAISTYRQNCFDR